MVAEWSRPVADTRPRCVLEHTAPNNNRYEVTIKEAGKQPEKIVCCRECSQMVYQRDSDAIRKQPAQNKEAAEKLAKQVELAKRSPTVVEIPKPVRLPDPPRVERSIGLDPPGYDRGRW